MYAHLTYKALTSTYILYACIRVVNVYLCVHVHVHTRMHICLIHNTHLPRACIRVSWRPVLVVEEAGVPGENHRP
jgi:hypothetical protein